MCRGFNMVSQGMWYMWIVPVILILIIGYAIYNIVKKQKGKIENRSDLALKILNERFAKSEIEEAEFETKKNNLRNI